MDSNVDVTEFEETDVRDNWLRKGSRRFPSEAPLGCKADSSLRSTWIGTVVALNRDPIWTARRDDVTRRDGAG